MHVLTAQFITRRSSFVCANRAGLDVWRSSSACAYRAGLGLGQRDVDLVDDLLEEVAVNGLHQRVALLLSLRAAKGEESETMIMMRRYGGEMERTAIAVRCDGG